MSDDSEIIGMTLTEAVEHVAPRGLGVRATNIDGQPRVVTRDYRTDRINVGIVDGKIATIGRRG